MTTHTHVTAPTRYVETEGVRYAYRRFGAETGVPLLMLPHFRAGMDHWDPAVTDGLAAGRPVVLFDNAGVGASSGQTPESAEGFAENVVRFLVALEPPVAWCPPGRGGAPRRGGTVPGPAFRDGTPVRALTP